MFLVHSMCVISAASSRSKDQCKTVCSICAYKCKMPLKSKLKSSSTKKKPCKANFGVVIELS